MSMKKLITGVTAALGITAFAGQAEAAPIPVELMLAIDGSGSIGAGTFNSIKSSYASVLGSSLITTDGTIAVGIIQFDHNAQLEYALTVIDSAAKKTALIAAVNAMSFLGGGTDIGAAVNLASLQLDNLNHTNPKNEVIDVQTDGVGSVGSSVTDAEAKGQAVNCLEFGGNSNCNWNGSGLDFAAATTAQLTAVLTTKIAQETGQLPEPTALALFGLGLAGLGVASRRRKTA